VLPLLLAQLSAVIARDGGKAAAEAAAAKGSSDSGTEADGTASEGGKAALVRRKLIAKLMRSGTSAAWKAAGGGTSGVGSCWRMESTGVVVVMRGLALAAVGGAGIVLGTLLAVLAGEDDSELFI